MSSCYSQLKALKASTVLYIVQKDRKSWLTLLQFSYSFKRNAFICVVRRSCSQTTVQTTSVVCVSAHKHELIVPLFLLTKTPFTRDRIRMVTISI